MLIALRSRSITVLPSFLKTIAPDFSVKLTTCVFELENLFDRVVQNAVCSNASESARTNRPAGKSVKLTFTNVALISVPSLDAKTESAVFANRQQLFSTFRLSSSSALAVVWLYTKPATNPNITISVEIANIASSPLCARRLLNISLRNVACDLDCARRQDFYLDFLCAGLQWQRANHSSIRGFKRICLFRREGKPDAYLMRGHRRRNHSIRKCNKHKRLCPWPERSRPV